MDKNQFKVQPEWYWDELRNQGYDGYDIMEAVEDYGWKPIGGWGAHGWNLGSWPYVIVYRKDLDILVWVEGDLEQYHCPDRETRNAIIDEIAFFYWKHANEDWVAGIHEAEYAPQYLRGPYRDDRGDEHDIKGERMYAFFQTSFLQEAALVFEGKGALRYVQVGRNVFRGTLRANYPGTHAMTTSKGVAPSHYVDIYSQDGDAPGC